MSYNSNSLTSLLPPEFCERSATQLGFHLLMLTVVHQTSRMKGKFYLGGGGGGGGGRKPPVAEDWSKNWNYNSYSVSILIIP